MGKKRINKIIFWIVIVLVIIVAAIFGYYFFVVKQEPLLIPPADCCPNQWSTGSGPDCVLAIASDPALCTREPSPSCQKIICKDLGVFSFWYAFKNRQCDFPDGSPSCGNPKFTTASCGSDCSCTAGEPLPCDDGCVDKGVTPSYTNEKLRLCMSIKMQEDIFSFLGKPKKPK